MKINVDNEDFEVFIERNGDTWIVEIEGVTFDVKTEGGLPHSKQSRKRGGSKRKLSGKISSKFLPSAMFFFNSAVFLTKSSGEKFKKFFSKSLILPIIGLILFNSS